MNVLDGRKERISLLVNHFSSSFFAFPSLRAVFPSLAGQIGRGAFGMASVLPSSSWRHFGRWRAGDRSRFTGAVIANRSRRVEGGGWCIQRDSRFAQARIEPRRVSAGCKQPCAT
jgi:hypothetical protein